MTANPMPGQFTEEQLKLYRQLQSATPYQAPAAPAAEPVQYEPTLSSTLIPVLKPTNVEDGYGSAGAKRKLHKTFQRLCSILNKLEAAGDVQVANEWRSRLGDQMGEFCVQLAADTERARQGLAERRTSGAMRAVINQAERDPIRAWMEDHTTPDLEGTPSRDLYRAFVEAQIRTGVQAEAIPSLTKWGRVLTVLGYPSKNVKRDGDVQKWRQMRPKAG